MKKVKLTRKGQIIKFSMCWGDSYEADSIDKSNIKLTGWKTVDHGRVHVGDVVPVKLKNNGLGFFIIYECETMRDPKDMFFAKARYVCGLENPEPEDISKVTYDGVYSFAKENYDSEVADMFNPNGDFEVEELGRSDNHQLTGDWLHRIIK